MRTRSKLATIALSTGLAFAGFAGISGSAQAATSGDTTTTFTLTGGELAITVPNSADLGSAATGTATIAAQLGAISVADGRGTLNGSWAASVASTDFTTGAGSAEETVANSNADYWSGGATSTTGTGTFTPGQATAGASEPLGAPATALTATSVVGNNTATWNPTVNINIPSASVEGTYTGTITHSVS